MFEDLFDIRQFRNLPSKLYEYTKYAIQSNFAICRSYYADRV